MGCCASSPQVKRSKSIQGRVGGAVSSSVGNENAFPRVNPTGTVRKETGHSTSATKSSIDYPTASRIKAPAREDNLLLCQKTPFVGPCQPPSRQKPPQMTTTNQRLDQNIELQGNDGYRGPTESPPFFIHHQQPPPDAPRLAYAHHNGVYGNHMGLRPFPMSDRHQFSNFVVAQQPHIQMGFRNVLGGTDFMHAPCAYPRRGLGEVASWYSRARPSAVDDGRLLAMRDADSQQQSGQIKTKETSKKKGKGRGSNVADGSNGSVRRRKSSHAIHNGSDEGQRRSFLSAPEVFSASSLIPPLPLSDCRQDVNRNGVVQNATLMITNPPTPTKRLSVAINDGAVSSATPKLLDKIDNNAIGGRGANGNDVPFEAAADLGESFDECHSIVSSLGEQSLSCLSALDVDEAKEDEDPTPIAHEGEGEKKVEGCAAGGSTLLNKSAEETDTDGLSDSLHCADRVPQLVSELEASDRNLPPVSDESDTDNSSTSSEDGDAEGKLGASETDRATEKIEEEFCYFYSSRGYDVEDGDEPVDGFPGWWRRKVETSDDTQRREGRLSLFVGCLEGRLPPLSPYRSYRPTIPRSARHALILTADPLKDLGAYSVYRRRRSESFGPSIPRQGRRETMPLSMHELNRDATASKPKAQAYQSKARRRRTSGSGRVFG